jgi:phosphatidylinositol glycan class A protein
VRFPPVLQNDACIVERSRLHPRAQVLPPEMIQFAQPSVSSLVDAVADAIPLTKHVVPADFHEKVRHMYSWDEVAARTEQVYFKIAVTPRPSLIERFERYSSVGPVAGVLCCFIAASIHLYWRLLEWTSPASSIEVAPDYPRPGRTPERRGATRIRAV